MHSSLIILQPPNDKSQQFRNYCMNNVRYLKKGPSLYEEFLKDVLTRAFCFLKEDGLCCLIFPKTLTTKSELIYAQIISMGTSNHTLELNDEIILMSKKEISLGKIAILKKGDWIETISRMERLTYVSISADEKESISESVWTVDIPEGDFLDEKVVRWLILSYSNLNEEIHDPFPELTKSRQICLTLGRKFLESTTD